MSDQTPDPTAWSDDQLDNLLDVLAERANERDDLDLPGTGASRRGVLASLLGLGGAAAGAGVASAIGESESYGSASGVVGTDSEPLNETNVQDLHAQDAQIDNRLEAEQFISAADATQTVDLLRSKNVGVNNGNANVELTAKVTKNVDTTSTAIHSGARGNLVAVYGVDRSDKSTQFFDIVSYIFFATPPNVIDENEEDAATRSYSRSGGSLVLSMGSGSYDVVASALTLTARD